MNALQRAKTLLVVASLSLTIGSAQASRSEPMVVPPQISVEGKPNISQAALREVMIRAASRRNWQVVSDAPGEITLKQNRQGKHEATVKIRYDATSYQISYVSSVNLNADPERQRIHPTYNMWLRNLDSDINGEITLILLK